MSKTISQLRKRYKPNTITLLFVAESPPDSSDGEQRFFYNPENERWDHMYRAVMSAVFPEFEYRPREKGDWLRKFQERGYFMVDAIDCPVNRLAPAERRSALKSAKEAKLTEIKMLVTPETPIILVKKNIFTAFNRPLRDAGYNVIHESFLPFPSYGHQTRFIEACRSCLRKAQNSG